MNEQVKSLANIWANRRSEDSQLGIVYTFTEPALEKFAELLIKECARVAFESDLKMAIGQWGADSAILKHFGIKE